MSALALIYTSTEFKTMLNFEVETNMGYDMAYETYPAKRYIPELLKHASYVIQAFGDAMELPKEFAESMCDEELDYLLMLLHKDVDALIDAHIYVELPLKHQMTLVSTSNVDERWIAKGIGLHTILLVRENVVDRVVVSLPTFKEASEEFILYDQTLNQIKGV